MARRGNEIGRINPETFEWEASHRLNQETGEWERLTRSPSFDEVPSIERLAKEQGVQPIENIDDLAADFWPEEESADDFIAFAMEGRREEMVPPEELALLRKKAAAWDNLQELMRKGPSYGDLFDCIHALDEE